MKFKSDIEVRAGLKDGDNDIGTQGQLLSSTGTVTNWIDQEDIVIGEADKAKSVTLRVKNSTNSAMTKGQVICEAVSATPPSGNLIEVALADNNGINKMPALGILNEDLDAAGGNNDEGDAIMFGKVSGIDTSDFEVGNEVFVSDTPGGLTTTKPTGVKYIQKVGVVIRDDAANGTIEVFGAGRVNDVPTPLYVDHADQRLGIGEENPDTLLHLSGNSPTIKLEDNVSGDYFNPKIEFFGSSEGGTLEYISNPTFQGMQLHHRLTSLNKNTYLKLKNGEADFSSDVTGGTTLKTDGVLQVTGSNDSYFSNGNVGIGITNPSVKLEVSGGNIKGDGLIQVENSSDNNIIGKLIIDYGSGNNPRLDSVGGTKIDFQTDLVIRSNKGLYSDTSSSTGLIIGSQRADTPIKFLTSPTTHATYSEAMRIAGDGNVGIGTDDPAQELHVDGNARLTGLFYDGTNSGGTNGQILSSDGSQTEWIDGSDIPGVPAGSGTTNYLARWTPNASTLGTGVTYDNGTNVGIGTNDPKTKLHVLSTVGSLPALGAAPSAAQIGGGAFGTLFSTLTSGKGVIQQGRNDGTPQAYDLSLQPSGGNVGIGITDPSQKLEVSGNALIKNGSNAYLYIYNTASFLYSDSIGNTIIRSANNFRIQTVGSSERVRVTSSGNVGINTTDPKTKLHVATGVTNDVPTAGTATGGLWVSNTNKTYGINMGVAGVGWGFIQSQRADGGTSLYSLNLQPLGGNVGIGTTDPTAKTHIEQTIDNGTIAYPLKVDVMPPSSNASGDGTGISFGVGNNGNNRREQARITVKQNYYGVRPSMSFDTTDYNSPYTDFISRMLIDPEGNVGIGTDNPTRKLHILGPGNSSPNSAGGIFLQTSGGGGLDIYATSTAANPVFNFRTFGGEEISFSPNSTELMRLKSSGVGIGTTNPSERLVVRNGTSNTDVKILAYNSAAGTEATLKFSTIASETNYEKAAIIARNPDGSWGRSDMHFALDSAMDPGNVQFSDTKMTIKNGGNVGIGTTTPDVKFEVESTTSASGIRIKNTNSGFASLDIESTRATGANLGGLRYKKTGQANSQAEINYVAGTRLDFLLGNGTAALTNKLSILENGNVGINDNTPSYKLDVNGTGRFTSTVTATNFILSSDETLKDNIKEIDTKHVDVDWKNFELKSEPGIKRAGVIAQELEIKHPEFVRTADDGLKSVAYIDLLITKIAELEARLEKLEK